MMREQAFMADASASSWAPIVLLDISLRGVSFATSEALDTGQVRALQFTVPGSPVRHRAHITVVRRSTAGVPSGFKIGAMFVQIDIATTDLIADFVSKSAQD
jgi:hypothetical protein